jgi:peroxiredoxin
MKNLVTVALVLLTMSISLSAQLKPGDDAVDFSLKNVDGKMVSLSDYKDVKGVVLVFTCNPCPFAKAYEQRIIKLHKNFASGGYPVVAINPNDETLSPDDTFENMKSRAAEKEYPFPYLKGDGEVYKAYGATRTPHVFVLENTGEGKFKVVYIGAIDNNAMDEKAVSEQYVQQAIVAIENGVKPAKDQVKAIGCTIKRKV